MNVPPTPTMIYDGLSKRDVQQLAVADLSGEPVRFLTQGKLSVSLPASEIQKAAKACMRGRRDRDFPALHFARAVLRLRTPTALH